MKMECQRWPDIGEVWNLVCCHGNKTVKLKLWRTFSRILLHRFKHFWYFFHHIWSKFGWVYDIITWLICIFKKLEYLWNKKKYLKIVNSIFLLMQATCLYFKMALIEKMQFSSYCHFKVLNLLAVIKKFDRK